MSLHRITKKLNALGKLAYELRLLNKPRYNQILAELDEPMHPRSIDRAVDNARLHGRIDDEQRVGRPKVLTDIEISLLDAYVDERDGILTRQRLRDDLNIDVKLNTVSRYLKELGYSSFKRIKAAYLKLHDKMRR